MRNRFGLVVAMAAIALGCSGGTPDEEPTSDGSEALGRDGDRWNGREVTVMTRNVYLGFDIAPILAAPTPQDVPALVAEGWSQMLANDFTARARAIAAEVERGEPHLIGLEEVGLFRRTPHDGAPAQEVDYLRILRRALAARGLRYEVAVVQTDSDVVAPMLAGVDPRGAPLLDRVEMIDRDVVLARADVEIAGATSARYAAALPVSLGGESIEIVRGWASVVARVDHAPAFRFVVTHLEEQLAPPIQLAQAEELLALLAPERLPVVLTGDFNSAADGSQTPTYARVTRSFVDEWSRAHPRAAGYTCCEPADLHRSAPLDQRLDLVLVRRAPRHGDGFGDDARASRVGDEPRDRTASGLWPSDHAGVLASFRVDGRD